MTTLYDFTVDDIGGQPVKLERYKGKVLLVVNTASKCGFTPQYKGLEALYRKYKDEGLEVLGFPCNQFGSQEPGNEQEIATFCETNYDVTFPMFAKVDVNGDTTAPVYRYLKVRSRGCSAPRKSSGTSPSSSSLAAAMCSRAMRRTIRPNRSNATSRKHCSERCRAIGRR